MFDKIMYGILGTIDDLFSNIENFFKKKNKKRNKNSYK
jgi:hypothetical protein